MSLKTKTVKGVGSEYTRQELTTILGYRGRSLHSEFLRTARFCPERASIAFALAGVQVSPETLRRSL